MGIKTCPCKKPITEQLKQWKNAQPRNQRREAVVRIKTNLNDLIHQQEIGG